MNHEEFHIRISADGKTALDWLADASGLSRQKLKQAMHKGCVWIERDASGNRYTQRLRRAKKSLKVGEILHMYYDESLLSKSPPVAKLLSDEGDYSVWIKPSGMLSQGSKWGDHHTLYRFAEQSLLPERMAFIVHRLDRAASGLMLLAHKKKVAAQFAQMFRQHEIEKHYRVSVEGDFSKAFSVDQKIKTITSDIDYKLAISHASIIEYDSQSDETLLDVQIETGRKHQIRKHCSGLGFPVVGDRLYGTGKSVKDLQLTAVLLKFKCPVMGEEKSFNLIGDSSQ